MTGDILIYLITAVAGIIMGAFLLWITNKGKTENLQEQVNRQQHELEQWKHVHQQVNNEKNVLQQRAVRSEALF
jgi:uncharacterized membrane-anchored protein YhcB (DUF1043 family)